MIYFILKPLAAVAVVAPLYLETRRYLRGQP